jgi:hypothetical protein
VDAQAAEVESVDMVTRDELYEYLGRTPFRPFRVMLSNGEGIDVIRRSQGVIVSGRFVVGIPPRWSARHVPLEELDRVVDSPDLQQSA